MQESHANYEGKTPPMTIFDHLYLPEQSGAREKFIP